MSDGPRDTDLDFWHRKGVIAPIERMRRRRAAERLAMRDLITEVELLELVVMDLRFRVQSLRARLEREIESAERT